MEKYLFLLLAYLLGSIPFSFLLGKWFKHEDIRKKGSGNIGTTNAYRVLGKAIGTAVLILDTLKSGIMVYLIKYTGVFSGIEMFHPLVYGFVSVLGHIYPVWFGFKGGKGVASSLGLLLVYEPVIALIVVPVFLIVEFLTRYVSVASTVAALCALTIAVLFHFLVQADIYLVITTLFAVSIIILRHQSNYQRLQSGCENRVKLFDWYDRWIESRKKRQ